MVLQQARHGLPGRKLRLVLLVLPRQGVPPGLGQGSNREVRMSTNSESKSNVFNSDMRSISPEQSHRREDEDFLRRVAGDAEEELQLQGAFRNPGAFGSHTKQIRQRARPSERLEVGEVHRDLQGKAPQEDSHRPGEDYRGRLIR